MATYGPSEYGFQGFLSLKTRYQFYYFVFLHSRYFILPCFITPCRLSASLVSKLAARANVAQRSLHFMEMSILCRCLCDIQILQRITILRPPRIFSACMLDSETNVRKYSFETASPSLNTGTPFRQVTTITIMVNDKYYRFFFVKVISFLTKYRTYQCVAEFVRPCAEIFASVFFFVVHSLPGLLSSEAIWRGPRSYLVGVKRRLPAVIGTNCFLLEKINNEEKGKKLNRAQPYEKVVLSYLIKR